MSKKNNEPIDLEELRRELQNRYMRDPLLFNAFNPAQIRFINAVKSGASTIVATMGNGTGKTHALVSILSAIMFPTDNHVLKGLHESWSYPKSLRICAPGELLKDSGAFQSLLRKLFPAGRHIQTKGGKLIHSQGVTDTGFEWDVMTYDQAPLQAAGSTKGAILYSEPPPRALFNENLARLRAGGIMIMEMTPLDQAGWVKDDILDSPNIVTPDGRSVGRAVHVSGTIWDNCKEMSHGGQLNKRDIEIMLSQYPEDERRLRETGAFGSLSGRVYPKFSPEFHVCDKIPDFLKDWWNTGKYNIVNIIDPHDRKPFAIGWYAVFPNNDVLCLAEFPDDSFPPFHKMERCDYLPPDYAKLIKETEEALGRKSDFRFIDPNFGNTMCFSTHKTITQELFEEGQKIGYDLVYSFPKDDLTQGHMAVKSLLGDPGHGIKAKLFFMSHCKNHVYCMANYGWRENSNDLSGISERINQKYKDFPDLVRYGAMSGFKYFDTSGKNSRPKFIESKMLHKKSK